MPPTDDLRIGDFSQPLTPGKPSAPSPGSAPGPSPAKERLDAAEAQLEQDAQRDEATLKPMEAFEERLKKAGITKERAAEIVDSVLLKGFWATDIKITSKIKARFRTRNARDTKRAQEILEAQRFAFDAHYQEMLTRLLLASSLEAFGDDVLPHPQMRKAVESDIEKSFQARIAYVDALPDPALRVLFRKLYEFDQMVSTALEEGAIENF